MKRISSILAIVTLSVLLTALSAGVGIVYCNHTETASLAVASSAKTVCDNSSKEEACCACKQKYAVENASCMSFKVLQINVLSISHPSSYCFNTIPSAVSFFLSQWNNWTSSPRYTILRNEKWSCGFRSPPRDYLRKLRILRL